MPQSHRSSSNGEVDFRGQERSNATHMSNDGPGRAAIDHAATPVQAFYGIRRVDDLADRRIEAEERDHLLPGPAPGRGDRGVFPGPFVLEIVEFGGGHVGGRSAVDPAQVGRYHLAVLPGAEVQAVAHQMHDAGLDHGLREGGGDGLGEALQPVDDGDRECPACPCSSARSSPRARTWRRGRTKQSTGLFCDPSHSRRSTAQGPRACRRG